MITPDVEFKLYNDMGRLPHFDGEENYQIVDEWRKQLQEADGILICTPEYAFGVPGSLKNALDWTVSSGARDANRDGRARESRLERRSVNRVRLKTARSR